MHTEGVEYKEILNIHVDFFRTEYIQDFCLKKRSKNWANLQLVEIRVTLVKLGSCGIQCLKIGFGFESVIMAINFPFLFLVIMYGLELGIQNLELWNTSNSTAKILMFSSSLFSLLISCFP